MTEVLTYEALKAERDAQQKRADALAVESVELRHIAERIVNALYAAGYEPEENSLHPWKSLIFDAEKALNTPDTVAALAAIQAQGVEKAQAVVSACRENICPGGLSENRQYEESIVQPHLDGIADELENLIIELREDA
ncbi:Uncharacterised protein [Serratia marcescens]|uniref:hypothetical protein n=1 Tax=Serratia marcescens TaxID=615 RepID=UPI00220CB517|nr:hypothetical protein [Serratia marcescens]CAI1592960.1 Uncharacterised protein [Serratia marcescens]CAI1596580.1 Uncharacterised protein [Serratia marcescens]CAI1602543.1 Uncharacterised protein [Serratia marcescens]CAI1967074.1 Uncharacterised protein [Serratia marcescens]CAI2023465.1 Uncharacterised protein [Serratia marcescens]